MGREHSDVRVIYKKCSSTTWACSPNSGGRKVTATKLELDLRAETEVSLLRMDVGGHQESIANFTDKSDMCAKRPCRVESRICTGDGTTHTTASASPRTKGTQTNNARCLGLERGKTAIERQLPAAGCSTSKKRIVAPEAPRTSVCWRRCASVDHEIWTTTNRHC